MSKNSAVILGTKKQVQLYVSLSTEIDIPDANEPAGEVKWFIDPPKYYRHYWNRKKEVVAQWLQSVPYHRKLFYGISSPHTFEEWIQKGRDIPYLEDTLIKFHESGHGYPNDGLLLKALDYLGTNKSAYIIQGFLEDKGETKHIRTNSALALGRKKPQPSTVKLLRSIALDPTESPSLRATALVALSELEGSKANN